MSGNITALLHVSVAKSELQALVYRRHPSFLKAMFGVCAKRSVVLKIAYTGQTNTQWSNEHLHYATLALEFSSPVFAQAVFKILWIMMIFPLPPPPYPLPPPNPHFSPSLISSRFLLTLFTMFTDDLPPYKVWRLRKDLQFGRNRMWGIFFEIASQCFRMMFWWCIATPSFVTQGWAV